MRREVELPSHWREMRLQAHGETVRERIKELPWKAVAVVAISTLLGYGLVLLNQPLDVGSVTVGCTVGYNATVEWQDGAPVLECRP